MEAKRDHLPPMTKRALELAASMKKLPADWDYRKELTDIWEKNMVSNEENILRHQYSLCSKLSDMSLKR